MWVDRFRLFSAQARMAEDIGERVPELEGVMNVIADEIHAFQGLLHSSAKVPSAVLTAATQAANDMRDLMYDVACGRGRPALRATRSLIDLAVTTADITSDPDLAERYVRHEFVTATQIAEMSAGLGNLRGNDLRAERHRRRKLRASAVSERAGALRDYGPGFERSWAPENLYERAKRHGLDTLYEFFRVSSAGAHGTAGGLFGLGFDVDERRTHRLGPDLAMAPIALDQGVLAYRTLVQWLANAYALEADGLLGALERLDQQYSALRKAMLELDKEISPDVPAPGLMVVRVLHTDGRRQWVLHDIQRGVMVACREPNLEREKLEAVEAQLDEGERVVPPPRRHLLSVAVFGAEAQPLPGERWYSDRTLIPFEEPVVVESEMRASDP